MTTTNTMPNNILVGSERLFRSKNPWTIDNSLLGLLSPDHSLLLFNTDNRDSFDRNKVQSLSINLFNLSQVSHGKVLFIGLENECRVAVDLHERYGFNFDCVVLVNNPYDDVLYESLTKDTLLYNFYTNSNGFDLAGADINQRIRTPLPVSMSKRLALEVYGCVLYGAYGQDSLNKNYGIVTYV